MAALLVTSPGHRRSHKWPYPLLVQASMLAVCLAASPCLAGSLSIESQQAYDGNVRPFLEANCFRCHGEKKTLAGLRLDTLDTDFLAGKAADVWREVYDRLGNGTMPPEKEPRPDAAQALAVTEWIIHELRDAEQRAKGASGRIPTRRLNRAEYANTLRDLFYLDENVARGLEQELPMDGKVAGFDRGGAGLFIDEAQMLKYIEMADLVLGREVFGPEPKRISQKSLARENLQYQWPDQPRSMRVRGYPPESQLANTPTTVPIGVDVGELKRGGVEFLPPINGQGNLRSFAFRWDLRSQFNAGNFNEGWYRFKIRAGAFKGSGPHALDAVKLTIVYTLNTPIEAKATIAIDAPLDAPRDYEALLYLRPGSPEQPRFLDLQWQGVPRNLIERDPAIVKAESVWYDLHRMNERLFKRNPPPGKWEIEPANRVADALAEYHHRVVAETKGYYVFAAGVDAESIPRLWIESFEQEGPIVDWPPKGRRELLFAGDERTVDKQYLREIFARFLPRAYRRPVAPAELDDVVAWVLKAQQANSLSGSDAVREGVKMVLCSPEFLLIQEPTGDSQQSRPLTDHELACRLSYFLWSSMPDAELFRLAAESKLHEPDTLRAQTHRMIADPKAQGLVRNFTGQWLKVREFSNVTTDRNQYKAYDNDLRDASWNEPYEFFAEVLRGNLSIVNFLDSDFVVINERLAAHYGIPDVRGETFRRVPLRPEDHRGGVLGMAGVLTYGSDGLRTLPVRRATYVLDALWNSPTPPPPPNVGDLPKVGKVRTVRERLEAHRQSDTCASCHAKIDPFGIALENYDAIGAWRDRQNGEGFKGDEKSPPLDVSGRLPSGREFHDLPEFKQALLAEKQRFVRGFVEKMLAYALGRPVGATDRGTVDEIVAALEAESGRGSSADRNPDEAGYRLQSLLQAVVATQAFQTK